MSLVPRRCFYGLCLAAGIVAIAPSLLPHLGLAAHIVDGQSMHPQIRDGDVIVSRRVPAREVATGDVVTFPDPEQDGALITHRVISEARSGTAVSFVTRGDASLGVERWSIPSATHVGRFLVRLPRLGTVAEALSSRTGRAAFLVPVAILAVRTGGSRRMT